MTPQTAQLLDGKTVSQKVLDTVAADVAQFKANGLPLPKLSVILVGENAASQVYVNRKALVAEEVGLASEVIRLPADISQADLQEKIRALNADQAVHGILVQLPLPKHLDTLAILASVDPEKDVDGFHPVNLGRLLSGTMPPALPCTPAGIMTLLNHYHVPIEGRHAVVIGRSNIVGKPMAVLLLQENATVTLCHSRTQNLSHLLHQADIVVAAVGIPHLVSGKDLRSDAVVVDVGMNRLPDGKLVGDVDFLSAAEKAAWITPVPGGVGPMTIATLMANTVSLYRASQTKEQMNSIIF